LDFQRHGGLEPRRPCVYHFFRKWSRAISISLIKATHRFPPLLLTDHIKTAAPKKMDAHQKRKSWGRKHKTCATRALWRWHTDGAISSCGRHELFRLRITTYKLKHIYNY
jgi:hypothetical protein